MKRSLFFPFPEHEGQYWGPPSNDEAAIQELERLRQTGAKAIGFFLHTFWWLEYYAKFNEYLHQEWQRLARENKILSLILIDVDYFKPYNKMLNQYLGTSFDWNK